MSSTRENSNDWHSLWGRWQASSRPRRLGDATRHTNGTTHTHGSSASALAHPSRTTPTYQTPAKAAIDMDMCAPTEWTVSSKELFRDCSGTVNGVSRLRHIQQQETWDCGIACLLMVADWLDLDLCRDDILQKAATESIWTVDLTYLLQDWNDRFTSVALFSYLFCSQTLKLNERLSDAAYYVDDFGLDRIRITQRLQSIRDDKWPAVQMAHLSLDRVVDCIQREHCIAIALVDNRRSQQQQQPDMTTAWQLPPQTDAEEYSRSSLSSYVGHFIILTGVSHDPLHLTEAMRYDTAAGHGRSASTNDVTVGEPRQNYPYCLVVQNPGCDTTAAVSYWSTRRFERAWRADGTDEDILFVVRHGNPSP